MGRLHYSGEQAVGKAIHLFILVCAFALGGCQSLFSHDMRLASAEPLFGQHLDICLDDPGFMIGLMARGSAAAATEPSPPIMDCEGLKDLFQAYLFNSQGTDVLNDGISPTDRRNEVVQALVGISNRKCGRYSAHIKTFDGQSNSILSTLAIATGGLGGIATSKGAARLLAGTSAIASGSRVAVNDAWFSNQTIQVLVAGYEKERSMQLRAMQQRQMCPIEYYPTMAGIADAMQYHASCSLIIGLSAAAQAIERSDQPGIDIVRRQLTEVAAIRRQAELVVTGLAETNSPITLELSGLYAQAEADYQLLNAKIASATASISEPIEKDGVRTYRSAEEIAAIDSQIAALTLQRDAAREVRDSVAEKLADAKATDKDNQTANHQQPAIIQSQSERLLCPLGPENAR